VRGCGGGRGRRTRRGRSSRDRGGLAEDDELSVSSADSGDRVGGNIHEVRDSWGLSVEVFIEESSDDMILEVQVAVLGVEVEELAEEEVLLQLFVGFSSSGDVEVGLDFDFVVWIIEGDVGE
jgi:hypothetical protein